MWRKCALVFFVVGGAACGSDPDYAPTFTGIWVGTATDTFTDVRSGQQATSQGQTAIQIQSNGKNSLLLVRFCDSNFNAGPHATPTSETEFSVQAYACTVVQNSCPEPVSLASGSGTLASGTLTITLTGTIQAIGSATCPSGTDNFTFSLVLRRYY